MHPRDRGRSTLEEAEREPILRALRASNWVMAGPDDAAAKVGMKRTALTYRVGKPKISCRPQRIDSLTRVLFCSSASSVSKQDNDGPRSHEVFYRREGQTRLPKVVGTR